MPGYGEVRPARARAQRFHPEHAVLHREFRLDALDRRLERGIADRDVLERHPCGDGRVYRRIDVGVPRALDAGGYPALSSYLHAFGRYARLGQVGGYPRHVERLLLHFQGDIGDIGKLRHLPGRFHLQRACNHPERRDGQRVLARLQKQAVRQGHPGKCRAFALAGDGFHLCDGQVAVQRQPLRLYADVKPVVDAFDARNRAGLPVLVAQRAAGNEDAVHRQAHAAPFLFRALLRLRQIGVIGLPVLVDDDRQHRVLNQDRTQFGLAGQERPEFQGQRRPVGLDERRRPKPRALRHLQAFHGRAQPAPESDPDTVQFHRSLKHLRQDRREDAFQAV